MTVPVCDIRSCANKGSADETDDSPDGSGGGGRKNEAAAHLNTGGRGACRGGPSKRSSSCARHGFGILTSEISRVKIWRGFI